MVSRWTVCRFGGVALLAIWIFLLFQPVSAYVVEGIELRRDEISPDMLTIEHGWYYALFGWLAALAYPYNFAWFANPLALWCLIDMLRGRQPNMIPAIAAPILAIPGLAPNSLDHFFDSHGTDSAPIMYYTTDAWVWSCTIPIIVRIINFAFSLPRDAAAAGKRIPTNVR